MPPDNVTATHVHCLFFKERLKIQKIYRKYLNRKTAAESQEEWD